MTGHRRLGLVAAGATLLASAPLSTIFETWMWLFQCLFAVALVAGAAVLTRTMRAPLWAQALGMGAALLFALTWMFPSGEEFLALLPTPGTFAWFGQLLADAGTDTRSYGVPVPDREGLLFVTALGVGGVAVLVDLLTVGLRRPALAGLPMLAIYSVPVAVLVDSVPVLPFVIGAIGFLWLLVADNIDRVRRFGRRFTGDGRDVDVWEPSPLAAAGRRLAAIGVAAAVLLPLVVPGISTGLLSRLTQTGGGAGTGGPGFGSGSGKVNLFASLSGQLNQSATTEMLRVTTDEKEPFYLRFGVADTISEKGFGNRSPRGSTVARGLPDPREQDTVAGVTYRQYRADVQVTDDFDMPMAPVYDAVTETAGLDSSWSYDRDMQVVFSNRSRIKSKRYSFDYVRATYAPEALRQAAPLPENNPLRSEFTTVPADDEVADLVAGLVRGKRTDYDKIMAIYQYFSKERGFTYSLETQSGTTGSDITAFLKNKSGFCQQYAAAMAWMVREAGIPARVAFGFTRGGSQNGNTYVLTNRNLHAWTEVYLDGFGWVPFDATPAAAVVGSTRSEWAPDTDRVTPTPSASSGAAAPGVDPSSAAGRPNRLDREVDPGLAGTTGGDGLGGISSGALLGVGIGALVLALLAVPGLRRVLVRRRRHAATLGKTTTVASTGASAPGATAVEVTTEVVRARQDAHAAWDELVDTMVDFKVPVDPTETPRHTAQRLVRDADLQDRPAEGAVLLGRAEEQARYARRPLQGGELTTALTEVRKALARTANRRTRLAAVLLPPSVVLRWRLGIADLSGRWVTAFGRRRDAASRWSPRRLLAGRAGR